MKITINEREHEVDVDPDMPLLWVLRDVVGLTGTKYGCGIAQCGACTVHVDGEAVRACVAPIGGLEGASVTTIEGLADADGDHPLQLAWARHDVPQCGYCQSGQLLQATALLADNPEPSDAEIDEAMSGNLCRCGTYARIRAAIRDVADQGVLAREVRRSSAEVQA